MESPTPEPEYACVTKQVLGNTPKNEIIYIMSDHKEQN